MKNKEIILNLRNQGFSYNQIVEKTGLSKSLVAYYCNPETKNKTLNRTRKYRKKNPIIQKIQNFQTIYKKNIKKTFKRMHVFKNKFQSFISRRSNYMKPKIKYNERHEHFTIQDVMNKIGENPKCYLTGKSIDLSDGQSYNLDHIIPASKGGQNTLENLGICTKEANMAKSDMLKEEFIQLCKDVLEYQGYDVIKCDQKDSSLQSLG